MRIVHDKYRINALDESASDDHIEVMFSALKQVAALALVASSLLAAPTAAAAERTTATTTVKHHAPARKARPAVKRAPVRTQPAASTVAAERWDDGAAIVYGNVGSQSTGMSWGTFTASASARPSSVGR
jgi:hypothetical protein